MLFYQMIGEVLKSCERGSAIITRTIKMSNIFDIMYEFQV